jgi:hypothetical protein
MTTLIIDGLNRDVLKKRSIVTLKWEDDPEKRGAFTCAFTFSPTAHKALNAPSAAATTRKLELHGGKVM